MFTLEIAGAGMSRQVEVAGALSIGRGPENGLVLEGPSVSKRHASIEVRAGRTTVRDLGSRNGTFLNGGRVSGTSMVRTGDRIAIGPYVLTLRADPSERAALRKQLHEELIERLDLRRLQLERLGDVELRQRAAAALREILAGRAVPDGESLAEEVLDEALGLGPLEALLADDSISEIMVNHASQIYVERAGRLERCDRAFSSNQAVLAAIERIVAPVGRRIDEASPLVDARLKDGSRVHAIIPPLALKGPCLTIRKFRRERLTVRDLVGLGTMSRQLAAFLELAVKKRRNVIISGGTGSGKTTLLNVLTAFIPDTERIVTVEDAAELQVHQPHWVQLEARPANLEGRGAVPIRELVKNCLRMRPDRIVVGECRGGEALDMLQAMNTGHDGSLTTLHANAPREALSRLETLCLMSGVELPVRAIREQIAAAVDLVVQQVRFADGTRRITHVAELTGMEGEVIAMQELFRFEQGRHVATGLIPRFVEELRKEGEVFDLSLFREGAR